MKVCTLLSLFVLFCFVFSCDSILLDFWAQSAVHMVLCRLRNGLCVCHGEAGGKGVRGLESEEGLDENVTEGKGVGGGGEGEKEGVMPQ